MMITLVLSSNMKRMLKNNVLVRKMTGIETAGSINMLFTDKTGTLTKGKLEVIKFVTPTFTEYNNEFEINNKMLFEMIIKSFVLNNESMYDEVSKKVVGGNITDRALLNFIKNRTVHNKVIERIPFDSKNKYSKVILEDKTVLIKGAMEKILPMCNYYYNDTCEKKLLTCKRQIIEKINDISKKGIRILTFAIGKEESYSLLGFAYIKDEIREEAKEGIRLVNMAHINTVMITGDNKETAYRVGLELGLVNADDVVITSEELNKMTNSKIKEMLPNLKIVARSLPQDKSKLIRLAQDMGYVVGMTGDGVNDAPALKKADVGFSMGSGTEIAKEASDIVILDDNFLSISKAILYGRTIFKSIRKFIILQLTANICALTLSIIGPFIGIDTPITVVQMLWINMVMDSLSGLAFSFEPPLLEYMEEPPKKKTEQIINKYMLNEILVTGLYSSVLCFLFLKLPIFSELYRKSNNNKYFMTAFFALIIFIDVFNAFNARTHRLNLLSNIRKNKIFIVIISFIILIQIFMIYYGGSVFRTSGLTIKELIITVLFAFTVIPVDNIRKLILRAKGIKRKV